MLTHIINLLKTKDDAILTMDALVRWKKSKNSYSFDSLPKTAIITVFNTKKAFFSTSKKKKIKGFKGQNFIVENKFVLCTGCGYGAPHVISLCEELKALGVSEFIFIGLAGMLDEQLNEGELFYLDKVFSGTGTSYYYDKQEMVIPHNLNWIHTLSKKMGISPICGWSTDAPFRETITLKNHYIKQGAKIVEMECAAIYAFANFYKLNAACYVITSDRLTNDWQPPQNISKLIEKEQELITTIKETLWNH
ncbi:hypothetical protein ABW636_16630 [Aquimarina sp. 2201CG1-2-11]|uniref:phosphorylase family protein n=1 Tax=Aquimarina discodermiae TaxID=3231043 RepID=UPI0034620176